MKKILFINACPRPDSRTSDLAQEVLKRTDGEINEVKLYDISLPVLDVEGLKKREFAAQSRDFSDPSFDLAKQFAMADTVVIAAPYWDLMFPAVLKCYLENITVAGITFRYSQKGIPESLCAAQTLCYITTSGGFIGPNDFGFSYVNALAKNFFGIAEVYRFAAEGLDIFGADVDAILEKAKDSVKAALFSERN